MSHPTWWHQITLSEPPCPHCEALRWLEQLEADPDNRYGFTGHQQTLIYAAFGVLGYPDEFDGVTLTRPNGETIQLHKCGASLVIPEFWASRMRSARAEWENDPASRVTEHVEGKH